MSEEFGIPVLKGKEDVYVFDSSLRFGGKKGCDRVSEPLKKRTETKGYSFVDGLGLG